MNSESPYGHIAPYMMGYDKEQPPGQKCELGTNFVDNMNDYIGI